MQSKFNFEYIPLRNLMIYMINKYISLNYIKIYLYYNFKIIIQIVLNLNYVKIIRFNWKYMCFVNILAFLFNDYIYY